MKKYMLMASLISLTACAPATLEFDKPGSTPQMFAQDNAGCQMELSRAPQQEGTPLYNVYAQRDFLSNCMISKGWQVVGEH